MCEAALSPAAWQARTYKAEVGALCRYAAKARVLSRLAQTTLQLCRVTRIGNDAGRCADSELNQLSPRAHELSTTWRYLKVPQKAFNQLQPADVADLAVLGS
jgi:hypothetical protein